MGKTAVLLLGLFTGLVSLTLQAISLGTEYWFEGRVRNTSLHLVKDYYNVTVLELHEIPVLPQKRGLFSYCGYHYEHNVSSTQVPSPSSENFQEGFNPSDVVVECVTYNFTQKPNPDLPGLGYHRTLYYLDRSAAGLGCVMLGLQLCGVLTSWQAAWTVITVLFTDCGTMFMFGSLMGLTSLLLVIASHQYEINERPSVLPPFPEDYALDYSWSFYLSWASLGLCIASGIMFLMVARQWHLEEVWFKKSLEEEKKRLPQQRYSRSKLIPSF